jgi:predicted DNA-binding transcriptional regulator AlpA
MAARVETAISTTRANGIPASVENFDRLPDSARLDLSCLMALTSKSRATIYRWIAQGILPAPAKLGQTRNSWIAGDVRRALRGGAK